ncbi:hypothetical protein SUGI_0452010 [Cryptomeria japonica]|nr:hypothetical protein SUGI_0452010 [Cryptomeria japonica]
MASSCSISIAFLSSHNSITQVPAPPKCTNISRRKNPQNKPSLRLIVANSASNGGSCCGGSGSGSGSSSSSSSGGSCSSHSKSSDLSNVGKEFEAMVARATLTEFEKEYNTSEMKGNITRDVLKEVMDIGPTSYAHQQKGETIFDLKALLSEDKNASKNEEFSFDNAEDVFV